MNLRCKLTYIYLIAIMANNNNRHVVREQQPRNQTIISVAEDRTLRQNQFQGTISTKVPIIQKLFWTLE